MKKLSYVLGLVAMTIMLTMTSCSGDSKSDKDISEDVQCMCDAMDECADLFNNCESQADVVEAFQKAEKILTDADKEGVDLETELTDDDKEALKESFVNYTASMTYKLIDLGFGQSSRSEAEEQLRMVERRVGEILDECETIGDFSTEISNVQW